VIAEATAADTEKLLEGAGTPAVDRLGMPYTKASLELLKGTSGNPNNVKSGGGD
jgi:hypothetical protein